MRCEARLTERVRVVVVDFVYRLRLNRGFSRGEFSEVVQDSGRDRAEGTGCMGALLSNVL